MRLGSDAMDVIKSIEGFEKTTVAEKFGDLLLQAGIIRPATFRLYHNFSGEKKNLYQLLVSRPFNVVFKQKLIFVNLQDNDDDANFENLFWLEEDDDETATLLLEDTSKEVLDEELTEKEFKSLKKVPTVSGLPYIGNGFQVTSPGDMSRSMQRLGKELCPKHGGIFWINLMHHKYIVLSDPDYVEAVLEDDECFGKKCENDAIFEQLRCFR